MPSLADIPGWAGPVLVVLTAACLGGLTAWGLVLQRMVRILEREHPEAFATLAARSRRKVARMAAVSALQTALSEGEPLPGMAAEDPRLAALAGWERRLRHALLLGVLALFGVFALA